MSIPDDLTSLVPDDYTERPSAGLVPNPLALIDAARLIAAVFGWSPSETFAGIFGAIWRGEIKRVFTWEAPRIRFHSEPDQEIEDILASPPPGTWVDGNAVASDDTVDGRLLYVRRCPLFWSRAEILVALEGMGYLPIDPALIDPAHPEIAYELLARQPLRAWGEPSRVLIWDRLLTSKRRLAGWWMATREGPLPAFLERFAADSAHKSAHSPPADQQSTENAATATDQQVAGDAQTECYEWLVALWQQPPTPERSGYRKRHYWDEAHARQPFLSFNAFKRAWGDAVRDAGPAYGLPGRRRN